MGKSQPEERKEITKCWTPRPKPLTNVWGIKTLNPPKIYPTLDSLKEELRNFEMKGLPSNYKTTPIKDDIRDGLKIINKQEENALDFTIEEIQKQIDRAKEIAITTQDPIDTATNVLTTTRNRNNTQLFGSKTPKVTTDPANKTNQLIKDLVEGNPPVILPIKVTLPNPTHYITPERYNQVMAEKDAAVLY